MVWDGHEGRHNVVNTNDHGEAESSKHEARRRDR